MGDDSIHFDYNQDLRALEELLSGVERAGQFFVSGSREIPMPKLEVEGVGVLSFPVPPTQAASLIQQATRAPYGRGAETILDESVRKVWQLAPEKVRLGGKSWAANFDAILQHVIQGLGCDGMTVSAELYKLLVYDTGSFFLAHRDTEKACGMFGTLVLVLPSAHRGGELVLRHAGREVVVDLSGADVSEVSFVAFYADCEHEVRPITEGNRVCLVFNLLQQGTAKGKDEGLRAPDYEKQIAAAAKVLQENLGAPEAPVKIAWLLEHQYSPEGLSFGGLKSADAARVKVLAQAAERAGCAAHLGIVHLEQSGAAQETYYQPRSRSRGRHHHDDEEAKEASSANFEVIDVSDSRQYVSQWRDLQEQPVAFGEIPLGPGELLPDGALDDEKPDRQRLMEASGNEGATFERSYHRAALVIWRRDRYAEVLLQSGVAAALPYLKESIEACRAKGAPPLARKEAAALAQRLVDAWKEPPAYRQFRQARSPDKRAEMLALLIDLGDSVLLEEFIAGVVTRDYDGSDNLALVASARLLGAEKVGSVYSGLVHQHMRVQPVYCVELLRSLASSLEVLNKPDWLGALRQISAAAIAKLDEIGEKQPGEMAWQVNEDVRLVSAAFVANLLDVLGEIDPTPLGAAAAEKFAARPAVFDPVTILVPALAMLRTWDAVAQGLWDHCAEFLLQRSAQPPESPKNWRQDVRLSCACADCRELQTFTLDPVEQIYRFRVRQERRNHLEQIIQNHSLDMNVVTERKGSPQTLLCTKDRRSYKSRCAQYRKDIASLAKLEAQAQKSSSGNPGTLERIAAARALAAKWLPA